MKNSLVSNINKVVSHLNEIENKREEVLALLKKTINAKDDKINVMTLTAKEILHLAQFAGFEVRLGPGYEDFDTEYTIVPCPKGGILGDDHGFEHYRMMAYLSEYPDEGMHGLGDELEEGKQ